MRSGHTPDLHCIECIRGPKRLAAEAHVPGVTRRSAPQPSGAVGGADRGPAALRLDADAVSAVAGAGK